MLLKQICDWHTLSHAPKSQKIVSEVCGKHTINGKFNTVSGRRVTVTFGQYWAFNNMYFISKVKIFGDR